MVGKRQKREISDNEDSTDSELTENSSEEEEEEEEEEEKVHLKKKLKTSNNNNSIPKKPLIKLANLSSGENQNQKLTDILTELSIFEKNKGLIHKFSAYRKAVQAIKAYPNKIKSGAEAQKLDGVGKKIAKKIDEILSTGALKKLKCQNQDETLTSINELTKISGIGPAKAKQLVTEEGIKSIDDLRKIKNKLTHHQQIGLKYYEEIEQRVPREEIESFEKIISDTLFTIDPDIISQVVGSYRRGLPTSGDIDILISHPNFTLEMKDKKKTFNIIEKLVSKLKKKNILIDDLSLGPLKYMGIGKLPDNYNNNKINKDSSDEECDTTVEDDNSINNIEDDDSEATEPEDNSKKEILKKSINKSTKTNTTITSTTNKTTKTNTTHIARRVDFKLIPYESYYFGQLHATGSDEFNRQMRAIALKVGYTLSEYSINKISHGVKNDKPILVDSEKEIFDIIGMEYYPPNKRNL